MLRTTGLRRAQQCGRVCVTTEEALRARQTRPNVHDRVGRMHDKSGPAHTIEEFGRDRDFSVATYLSNRKKK